jgi:hypothetical protein
MGDSPTLAGRLDLLPRGVGNPMAKDVQQTRSLASSNGPKALAVNVSVDCAWPS